MSDMRAYQLIEFGEPVVERRQPIPEPRGTEVLIRIAGAGVCHSDLHICDGYYDLGHGKKLSFKERGFKLPMTLGHESAGVVEKVGPDAAGVVPGQSVLTTAWVGCGDCEMCRTGEEQSCATPCFSGVHCDGGYAEYMLVRHPRHLFDLGDIDPVEAAPLACSGVTTYSGLKKFGDAIRTTPVVIVGAGGLGLMAINVLRMMGGVGAVVVEIDASKRAAAIEAGALAAVDPTAPDALARLRAAVGKPIVSILDLVGSGDSVAFATSALDRNGALVIIGLMGGDVTLSTPMFPTKAIILRGSYVGSLPDMQELVDLVKRHGLPKMPLHRRPLAEADTVLNELRRGEIVGRVVLVP